MTAVTGIGPGFLSFWPPGNTGGIQEACKLHYRRGAFQLFLQRGNYLTVPWCHSFGIPRHPLSPSTGGVTISVGGPLQSIVETRWVGCLRPRSLVAANDTAKQMREAIHGATAQPAVGHHSVYMCFCVCLL